MVATRRVRGGFRPARCGFTGVTNAQGTGTPGQAGGILWGNGGNGANGGSSGGVAGGAGGTGGVLFGNHGTTGMG
ncbi:hypothetical protein AWC23_18585 [Mycobacterium saskatchewanense]|uniref:Uncharacterized protein n=1 Tax=Mycobacterium saskatchewanense TaxID=220927 RepID=A0AAJ3NP32_9MYCO|nr:hypothetical protein AWC23_18585 [Mycobacterium saskatchewanense]